MAQRQEDGEQNILSFSDRGLLVSDELLGRLLLRLRSCRSRPNSLPGRTVPSSTMGSVTAASPRLDNWVTGSAGGASDRERKRLESRLSLPRRSGGIGRRSGFKIRRPQGCTGSSPVFGTERVGLGAHGLVGAAQGMGGTGREAVARAADGGCGADGCPRMSARSGHGRQAVRGARSPGGAVRV